MAITKKGNTASNTNAAGKEFEKAKAFINISLPSRDGKSTRLHALPLVESNPIHAQLLAYFSEAAGDEALMGERVEKLKNRLVIDIGFTRDAESSALALD